MKFNDKVAIVTGGAGWIGKAICAQLAAEGAAVAVADINLEMAQAVADKLPQNGTRHIAVQVDVRDRQSVKRMAQAVLDQYGGIDILVNNAGGSARSECSLFHEASDEVVQRILEVNLMGPIYCTREVVEHMVQKQSGKIINISSIIGIQGLARNVDYSAAKGGVIAFTKSLAMELGAFGINVNCVSPGRVPRPGQDAEATRKTNYLNAICSADDVANVVRFLATDEARFITGQNYVVDGGRSLGLTNRTNM